MEYIIKNGIVYDPLNGINGEKMDICVKDGKIVESVSDNAKVIDASGCVVMPGGIDSHSHVAGAKVNVGRIFRPEDSKREIYAKKGLRTGTGFSVPSTYKTGYQYSEMGYTTVIEAAMPPLIARHTHEEFMETPQIDKAAMPLFGNNWMVLEYLKEGDIKACAAFVAWLLKAVKGFAIKIVNPGGTEAWGWGKNVHSLDDPVPYFDITPREIVRGLAEVNELLGLPHSIHVHPNNLGHPGNWETTLETMKCVEGVEAKPRVGERETSYYNTHCQFHSYGGTSWKDFESKAIEIAEYVNKSKHVVIDVGQVTLDETTTMTADGPMEYDLHMTNGLKWANCDVELETGSGVVPFIYSPKGPVYAVQWAIGLELFLNTNTDKVLLTTDHPNAGPFTRYPRVIAWLMSKKYRDEWLYNKVHKWAQQRSHVADADKEYDLYEIAKITRANQAKVLGLSETKGHLGVGAEADIAIYAIDPEEKDGKKIEKAFRYAKYVLKGGEVVVKDGNVVKEVFGDTIYVDVQVGEDLMNEVLKDVGEKFRRYYSVNLENYPVSDEYANSWRVIKIDATDIN
ncbi:formylmethanofuran dehydrogenase, subunit A (tungsten) (fwdA) [Methanocaldococcus jannaschii DSM 2661]|uniref:Protein FwdA n=1 Tax=Methanocaldococcus jannaschii (strain ATCC 43067 / DSM 2661 / JAL-1 / JCM 10045 / NBRC 100440) TaxID=243232 RepID=FWDA_METJA|nr:tungsten-dependent formylmethanofuran dehydrogenase subunit FwdA [Methanocaldococcus jannaschii]Q58569.1 RecName: Full=Protein FwdA [Methanocaldococcus jannaschii DSM 2661]AAB99171.1 formylmethanofuran dehydrogenase, subunit A (tungsten) (fwdA) [Methanocaldococcus jannaschii DSM 2661]